MRIIALIVGLLPAIASAEVVSRTYGLGNVHEPMAACGTDGCQVLRLVGTHTGNRICSAGVPGSEDMFLFDGQGNRIFPCVSQGPDELLSSVIQIQSDAALGTDPVPGRITIEECVGSECGAGFPVGAVRIPENSLSGFHNRITLNLEIFGDTFIIPSAIRFRFDGATGTGSPTGQIVWNNPVPYILEGCLICISGSGGGCDDLGLINVATGIEGDPVCNGDVQPLDPRLRDMPNWISDDAGDTWHFPSNQDGFYSSTFTAGPQDPPTGAPLESIYSDDIDRRADTGRENGGAWILRGFLNRECGTMNLPSRDAFIPSAGKPDPDCDGDADWRYGTGGFSEPACLNNGDPDRPIFALSGAQTNVGVHWCAGTPGRTRSARWTPSVAGAWTRLRGPKAIAASWRPASRCWMPARTTILVQPGSSAIRARESTRPSDAVRCRLPIRFVRRS
jgi:hypothetical protein